MTKMFEETKEEIHKQSYKVTTELKGDSIKQVKNFTNKMFNLKEEIN